MGRAIRASAFVLLVACSGTEAVMRSPTDSASPSFAPSPAGSPVEVSSLTGMIVFSDATDDIWSIRADGTHLRRLTSAPAMEFDPTWAPDGSRIAYRHQTGDDQTTEIFVMDADGSDARNLTRNHVADWGPAWSPDGREIAWNSSAGAVGFGFYGYVMAPDGSNVRRITHHYVEYPAWSPDGSAIAFMAQEPGASGANPDYNIFTMRSDGTDIRRLTRTPGEDGWPAWSPDGSQIVFSSARDDCSISTAEDCRTTGDVGPWQDVWIMNADGSDQRRISSQFGQFFTWSPDGSLILVAGAEELYLIGPDGSDATPFPVHGVAHPLFPDWIP
jgi:Tol biopolymer transport system component